MCNILCNSSTWSSLVHADSLMQDLTISYQQTLHNNYKQCTFSDTLTSN